MTIAYSPLAIRDLQEIARYYRTVAAPATAAAIAERIELIIDRASQAHAAPRVVNRPGVRAVLVPQYSCKIFYRVRDDVAQILHIRHTARRPWNDNTQS